MFTEIGIENFKSFGKMQRIPLKPITLIYGPNRSVKSSLIQALLLLKQTLEESGDSKIVLLPKGNLVDLGGYQEFIHGHDAGNDFRLERGPIGEGARFVAIYDQTCGSLRLSARILEERTLHGILEKMAVVMKLRWEEGSLEEDSETAAALGEILACLGETPEIISIGVTPAPAETAGRFVRVILPGSKGLNLRSNNEEFVVESVCYSPNYRGPAYSGRGCEGAIGVTQDVKTILALDSLLEIPGESKAGWYDQESGETAEIS